MAYLEIQTHRKNPIGLLRQSYREDGKVKKETLGRITGFSLEELKAFQATFKGQTIGLNEIEIVNSREYGASHTLLTYIKSIGLDKALYSRPSEQWVKLVIGMIIGRLLYKGSKLSLTRTLDYTTLWSQLGIGDIAHDVNFFYDAMDELFKRQGAIQKKLANRHLQNGELLLYDITSSYVVGEYSDTELVSYGYNRDRKKGFEQIVIGLLCNQEGCPIGVEVFQGNTRDNTTVEGQIKKITNQYGFSKITFIGDRGMIQPDSIENMSSLQDDGLTLTSVTALTHSKLKKVCVEHQLTNEKEEIFPAERVFSEYPDKRVVLYYNSQRAKESQETRRALMTKTEQALKGVQDKKRPVTDDVVGVRVGKVINQYKVGKFFNVLIKNGQLKWTIKQDLVKEEEKYDGLYAVVTDVPKEQLNSKDIVHQYKRLSRVEQAFRVLKSSLLELRPIRHHTDDRIRGHVFLCMLSYYVTWHMTKDLQPILEKRTSGQGWSCTMDDILENLKSIRENELIVNDVPVKKVTTANSKQQKIIDLLLNQ